MLKKISWLIVIALVLFTVSAGTVCAKEFINGIDANFPPLAYVDQAGKPGGFEIDAIDWIAKKM